MVSKREDDKHIEGGWASIRHRGHPEWEGFSFSDRHNVPLPAYGHMNIYESVYEHMDMDMDMDIHMHMIVWCLRRAEVLGYGVSSE